MADLAVVYADTLRRLTELLAGLEEATLTARVLACPGWTVRDVLAHLTGVAADAASGTYFSGAADAWSDAGLAAARDRWTAGHVRSRRDRTGQELLAELADCAAILEPVLAGTVPPLPGTPAWMLSAPVADLAVHLYDVHGALRRPGNREAPAIRAGLRIYAAWLGERLDQAGRPALRLRAGGREWVEGSGPPAAALAAGPFDMFRALSGRRSLSQVLALAWDGDPDPYLDLFAPYPMPALPLAI
jgi:uncharacterized protein (TIGR03083 family)